MTAESPLTADEIVDCTGLACPLPVVRTAQAIRNLRPGQVLELIATDPGVEPDMRAWSRRTGHELLAVSERDGAYRVLIRKQA